MGEIIFDIMWGFTLIVGGIAKRLIVLQKAYLFQKDKLLQNSVKKALHF